MKYSLISIALAAALPLSAQAGDLSYSYVEGGYDQLNQNNTNFKDFTYNGGYLRGSYALSPSFYLLGAYQTRRTDDITVTTTDLNTLTPVYLKNHADLSRVQAGIGYRYGLSDRADLVSELSFTHVSYDLHVDPNPYTSAFPDFSGSDNGYLASIGVRAALSKNVEGLIKANYWNENNSSYSNSGEFSGSFGAQYKFTPRWGATAEATFGDHRSEFLLGLRASF